MTFRSVCLTTALLFAATASASAQGPATAPASPPTSSSPPPSSTTPPSATGGGQSQGSATAQPDVATLLFGRPQWSKAPVGSVLTYNYAKKTTNASFGPSFEDHIVITLGPGHDADARAVDAKMFSGANAKGTGQFDSAQNPVLLLVFEANVQELAKLFGTNARYLKNRVRDAWRDHAKIEPVQIDVDGKQVSGTRITVQPFIDNPQSDRMKGLEGMVYTVEIADDVPGNIATIDIHAPADGAPKFSETLHFASMKAP